MFNQQWSGMPNMPQQTAFTDGNEQYMDENDNTRRPPNAFILYSKKYRTQIQQENPSLSNTDVSRLLGKMWKEVPNETKLQYKQRAAKLQEEFKKSNPNYTYRKARRKRALNDMLSKSTQNILQYPLDQQMWQLPNQKMFGNMQMGVPLQAGIAQIPGISQIPDLQQVPVTNYPANFNSMNQYNQ